MTDDIVHRRELRRLADDLAQRTAQYKKAIEEIARLQIEIDRLRTNVAGYKVRVACEPDLLAACKAIIQAEDGSALDLMAAVDMAKEAIAKTDSQF